jgi:hypothetical protein
MPLYPAASDIIRKHLREIDFGRRVQISPIGRLTAAQLTSINAGRSLQGLNHLIEEVVFVGGHIYKSRIRKDGYTIDDVIDQIASAMAETAVVLDQIYLTMMENPRLRADRYGNMVRDRAIFECSTRHPRAELFSVIPKGDRIKPPK